MDEIALLVVGESDWTQLQRIDPGAVVKFSSGGRLDINGILTAVGTESSPVVFTKSVRTM